MARYHLSPNAGGEPRKCSAKIKCEFADANNGHGVEHYNNKTEAEQAYVKNLEKEYSNNSIPLRKNKTHFVTKANQEKFKKLLKITEDFENGYDSLNNNACLLLISLSKNNPAQFNHDLKDTISQIKHNNYYNNLKDTEKKDVLTDYNSLKVSNRDMVNDKTASKINSFLDLARYAGSEGYDLRDRFNYSVFKELTSSPKNLDDTLKEACDEFEYLYSQLEYTDKQYERDAFNHLQNLRNMLYKD